MFAFTASTCIIPGAQHCNTLKTQALNTQALAAGPKRLGTARVAGGTQVILFSPPSPAHPLFLE